MRTPIRPVAQPAPRVATELPAFDLYAFLNAAGGVVGRISKHAHAALIYSQGDPATAVFYIQQGAVRLSVLSKTGKEAVVSVLVKGDFFGEGCLAGQTRRAATASAVNATTVLTVKKPTMLGLLHTHPQLADRFLSHMLSRNNRIEEDLVDQLVDSVEKRLARVLLVQARYGTEDPALRLKKLSREALAEMVGTTVSRIDFFMTKFRDLGFIDYNGDITVHNSLLTVVLHD